ncbi:hypothetical protein QQF64_018368 [Cirrhinus molitorella]|uniref:Uncharacterized protein n=1 Tax=Cirrhinus molitorella TaxID=172907 RepID=A0ABR3LFW6_9TELE
MNTTLKEEVGACKRYSWRWTLKLHGVQEKDGEDVRDVVIKVLGNVVPGVSERMEDAVDIAHRLGPRKKDEALSPEDRVAREKLWPLVKKARDEGKKASFRGSFALIDGKRFDYVSVK